MPDIYLPLVQTGGGHRGDDGGTTRRQKDRTPTPTTRPTRTPTATHTPTKTAAPTARPPPDRRRDRQRVPQPRHARPRLPATVVTPGARRIAIDPITRIEGHLRIEVQVENGQDHRRLELGHHVPRHGDGVEGPRSA